MATHLSIANLPADIIRVVVRIERSRWQTRQAKLNSRSWNAIVHEYERKHLGSLERVYFYAGHPQLADYVDCVDYVCVARRVRAQEPRQQAPADNRPRDSLETQKHRVQMYAIMANQYANRVPVGEWLGLFRTHSDSTFPNWGVVGVDTKLCTFHGAVEVASEPSHIATTSSMASWEGLVALIYIGLHGLVYAIINPICGILIIAFTVAIFTYHNHEGAMEEKRVRARFSRFFSSFANIETLVLGDLVTEGIFNAVHDVIGDVSIGKLEFTSCDFNSEMRDRIVKLCRRNGIRRVCVISSDGNATGFLNFAIQMSEMGVSLDVYATEERKPFRFFNESSDSWRTMRKELRSRKIRMKFSSIYDFFFCCTSFPVYAKAHIQIAQYASQRPVMRSRGFIREPLYCF